VVRGMEEVKKVEEQDRTISFQVACTGEFMAVFCAGVDIPNIIQVVLMNQYR